MEKYNYKKTWIKYPRIVVNDWIFCTYPKIGEYFCSIDTISTWSIFICLLSLCPHIIPLNLVITEVSSWFRFFTGSWKVCMFSGAHSGTISLFWANLCKFVTMLMVVSFAPIERNEVIIIFIVLFFVWVEKYRFPRQFQCFLK